MYLSFPFGKDSPFRSPIVETLTLMMKSGTIERIWRTHGVPKQFSDCGVSAKVPMKYFMKEILSKLLLQTTLGFNQLVFPVIILLFGALISSILALGEKISRRNTTKLSLPLFISSQQKFRRNN